MKRKMMTILFIAMLAMISNVSCVKQEYIDEDEPVQIIGTPLNDGLVSIQVTTAASSLKSATLASDTVSTEKFLRTTYQAIAKSGITIVSWQWTFAENNSKSNSPTVDFWHGLDPGSKTSVTLVGVEANGTAHTATKWIRIVYSLDGMPGFVMVSKTAVAGGSFSYTFAAHKKGMQGTKGPYGYTGNISVPTWQLMPIAAADTNYNYVNGALVAASTGDVGKYVAVRAILAPGEYEVHVGHIKDSKLIWGNFWSFYKDGKFTVTVNGDLSGLAIVGLPGASGDEGVNAVIRKDILATSVIVYTKHTSVFTKGFIQLQKSDGTWQTPIAEVAVLGYPNWGKVEIAYASFPTPELLAFRFGPNMDTPNVFSTNMSASGYWDRDLQIERVKIVPVN